MPFVRCQIKSNNIHYSISSVHPPIVVQPMMNFNSHLFDHCPQIMSDIDSYANSAPFPFFDFISDYPPIKVILSVDPVIRANNVLSDFPISSQLSFESIRLSIKIEHQSNQYRGNIRKSQCHIFTWVDPV